MIRKRSSIFPTDKRIRLGIWGLGRGMSFFHTCAAVQLDVVAGCDYNAHMRERFSQELPDAKVTADADEFLSWDIDAVLLATYCPAHADDAIRCLRAGKHVLSEVTAFHTMGEGVRLVEAVERSGLVYNLAENYPFSPVMRFLARKYREGLFGELQYAEFEYVHEIRSLAYTYIDGVPVQPGHTVHNWRSWLNFHYYNTHSLGPMMTITGLRPTRVVSLWSRQRLPGYPLSGAEGMGGIAPSLINMSNGAVVRNLMGATTNDTHQQRLWGTLGSAEVVDGELRLRLGGAGWAPKLAVEPDMDELDRLALGTGHGGGDFWVLYYFARQILTGEPAPFDIYNAADCTIPGILAYRSARENGTPYDVPDFRDPKARRAWRDDEFACPRFDIKKGCFPRGADPDLTGRFTALMKDLDRAAVLCRAFFDWRAVSKDIQDGRTILEWTEQLIERYPAICATLRDAQALAAAYPRSEGARVLNELLQLADAERILEKGFLREAKAQRRMLQRLVAK